MCNTQWAIRSHEISMSLDMDIDISSITLLLGRDYLRVDSKESVQVDTIIDALVSEDIEQGTLARCFVGDNPLCVRFTAPVKLRCGDTCTINTDNGDLYKIIRSGQVIWLQNKVN